MITDSGLLSAAAPALTPADPEAATAGLAAFMEATRVPELADFAAAFTASPPGNRLLTGVFGCSPFLTRCILRDPAFFRELALVGPDAACGVLLGQARRAAAENTDAPALMAALRRIKRRAALAVALADLCGLWPLEKVTGMLSALAAACLDAALDHALRGGPLSAGGAVRGFTVLGMGKLGAMELNYSSDIDLILLYDPERAGRAGGALARDGVRAARDLVRLLGDRTGDGYVFRVDLRLRPDPGATPLAIPVEAAETYYGSLAQNWERAAMIKARPVAGDLETGQLFLDHIRPFVWRRHLDFASIEDIHAIRRQIDAHYGGGGREGLPGRNIKTGRGGIREIEFFVQTQQLIWGGRQPDLRVRGTEAALDALCRHRHISPAARDDMRAAYRFLRQLEHRLQMVDDRQTHSLPDSEAGVDAIAAFAGYADPALFRRTLREHLERVGAWSATLFGPDEPAAAAVPRLVFTGPDEHEGTRRQLLQMGFTDSGRVRELVNRWLRGHYRATRTERARQLLDGLLPGLLKSLSAVADPDAALLRFDGFLAGLPEGVQIFSLFQANTALLDLVAEIMGCAPKLAARLTRNPLLLDAVLSPDFFRTIHDSAEMSATLAAGLDMARDYQDTLDAACRWANDRKFQIGVQLMRGLLDGPAAAAAYSAVAETVIQGLLPRVEADFVRGGGAPPAGGVAVLAFGKLGGREVLPRSDLDLVYLYDAGAEGAVAASVNAIRLCQRFGTALDARGPNGRLYAVDSRLRPDGNAGPLAVRLDAFCDYYRSGRAGAAWVWEHMALTRARPVYGPPALRSRLEREIRALLCQSRDPAETAAAVVAMRGRLAAEFPVRTPWDIKHRRGGLLDVEFIAQYLQLVHASRHPEILFPNTALALAALAGRGLLPPADARALAAALNLWTRLSGVLRLTGAEGFTGDLPPEGLHPPLLRAAGAAGGGMPELLRRMDSAAAAVRDCFRRLIPASGS